MFSRLSRKSLRVLQEVRHAVQYRAIYQKFRHFTMIPESTYIKNLLVAERVSHQEGGIIECGVWRGGMIAGIADLLGGDRPYYLFDSFEGLPPAKPIDGEAALAWQANKNSPLYHNNNFADIEVAQQAMAMSSATNYELIKGWFDQTLPQFQPSQPIALLRLDGDWYDSTLTCLKYLLPHVSDHGIVILDDYYTWDGCSRALHRYLADTQSTWKIHQEYNEICVLKKY